MRSEEKRSRFEQLKQDEMLQKRMKSEAKAMEVQKAQVFLPSFS